MKGNGGNPGTKRHPERLWSRSFIMLLIVNFLIFFGFHTMTPTLPLYARTLGVPDALLGWIVASTTIAAIIFRPFVGVALDRFGRKWLFLFGILFMGLITLSITFFPSFAALIVLRTLMGVVWAVSNTAASTIAADIIPRSRFGEGIGFTGFSASFAMAFSPALALYIFHAQGIEPALYLGFGSFVASLLIALMLKYRSHQSSEGGTATRDTAAPAVRDTEVASALRDTAAAPAPTPASDLPPGQTSTSAPAPAPASAPAPAPRGIATFIENRALLPALMAFFLMASFGAVQSFAAILAEARSIDGSPLFFFAFAGLMLLTRPVFGRITDRRGYRLPMLLGISFVTAGIIVLSFAQSLTLLLTSAVMIGIGFGAANPATQTMAVADVSPTRRGIATATYFVGFDGGIGIGSVIGGLLAQGLGYGQMFQIVAVLPVVALLIFLLTEKSFTPKSPKPSKPTDASAR